MQRSFTGRLERREVQYFRDWNELLTYNNDGSIVEVGTEGETSGSFAGDLTKPSLLYKDIGFEAGN